MKTLKESILSNMESSLNHGDATIKKLSTFGGVFKFDTCSCWSQANLILNAIPLKQLTKNMEYYSDKIEYGKFDKQNKFKLFANWLDHLTFEEIGVNPSHVGTKEFYTELGKKLTELCLNLEIGKEGKGFTVWVNPNADSNSMILQIANLQKSIAQTVRIKYIVNK
jgi:hypothetical protein